MRALLVCIAIAACRGEHEQDPVAPAKLTPAAPASPAAPSDDGRDACANDGDCVVTNFAGCCACPQCSSEPPYAISQLALQRDQSRCARVDCNMDQCNVGGMCPPGEPADHFVARCRDRRCVAERR